MFSLQSMQGSATHRFLDAATALFFVGLSVFLIVLATKFEIHDGNYTVYYLGLGVWIECAYLAVHFCMAAIFISRSELVERIRQVAGIIVVIPIGLITLILLVLLDQSIRSNDDYEAEATAVNWIFASLILILLVAPWVLICRRLVSSFRDRRAESHPRTSGS